MAIRVRYNYTDYYGFPAATAASRAFNGRFAVLTVLFFPLVFLLSYFLFQFVGWLAFVIAILVLLGFFWFVRQFYGPYIVRKIINSLDLPDNLKETAINHFTNGKRWGKVEIDGAHKYAYAFSHLTYQYRSGELTTDEYRESRRPFLKFLVPDSSINSVLASDLADIKLFFFENSDEYNIYLRHHAVDSSFHWESKSTTYIEMITKANNLLENGYPNAALDIYRNALEINPIAIKARYGMAACYSALGQPSNAKEEILKMANFFVSKKDIAYYYRHLGSTLFETKEYEAAYACYKYSLLFEETNIAFEGMNNIENESGHSFSSIRSEEVLNANGYLAYVA